MISEKTSTQIYPLLTTSHFQLPSFGFASQPGLLVRNGSPHYYHYFVLALLILPIDKTIYHHLENAKNPVNMGIKYLSNGAVEVRRFRHWRAPGKDATTTPASPSLSQPSTTARASCRALTKLSYVAASTACWVPFVVSVAFSYISIKLEVTAVVFLLQSLNFVLRIRTHICNSPRRSLSMYVMTWTLLHAVSEMKPGLGASRCILLPKFSWEQLFILLNFLLKSWSHHKVKWIACLENRLTILERLLLRDHHFQVCKWCKVTHPISSLAIRFGTWAHGEPRNLTLPRFRWLKVSKNHTHTFTTILCTKLEFVQTLLEGWVINWLLQVWNLVQQVDVMRYRILALWVVDIRIYIYK